MVEVTLLRVTRIVLTGFILPVCLVFLYSLAGGLFKPCSDGDFEKAGGSFSVFRSQHGRWCLSQCQSTDRDNAGRGDIQRRLLCVSASDRRSDHRIYYQVVAKMKCSKRLGSIVLS